MHCVASIGVGFICNDAESRKWFSFLKSGLITSVGERRAEWTILLLKSCSYLHYFFRQWSGDKRLPPLSNAQSLHCWPAELYTRCFMSLSVSAASAAIKTWMPIMIVLCLLKPYLPCIIVITNIAGPFKITFLDVPRKIVSGGVRAMQP